MSNTTKIAALREARGLTQKDLGEMMKPKTSSVQISRLENEDRRMTLDWLRRFAAALKVNVPDLLSDADVGPRPVSKMKGAEVTEGTDLVVQSEGVRLQFTLKSGNALADHAHEIVRLARIEAGDITEHERNMLVHYRMATPHQQILIAQFLVLMQVDSQALDKMFAFAARQVAKLRHKTLPPAKEGAHNQERQMEETG